MLLYATKVSSLEAWPNWMIHYFAYGSNLSRSQMQDRCPGSRIFRSGCLEGYRIDFPRFSSGWSGGVADVVKSEGAEVWGVVYEITDSDLKKLDKYEGYPHVYTRFQTTIRTGDAEKEGVWTYTVREKAGFIPPNQNYLGILKNACVEYEFPDSYWQLLNKVEVAVG